MTPFKTGADLAAKRIAFYFNMPCLMTMSATAHETHSLKWTLRVAGYYIIVSLVLAAAAYHIGCLIF